MKNLKYFLPHLHRRRSRSQSRKKNSNDVTVGGWLEMFVCRRERMEFSCISFNSKLWHFFVRLLACCGWRCSLDWWHRYKEKFNNDSACAFTRPSCGSRTLSATVIVRQTTKTMPLKMPITMWWMSSIFLVVTSNPCLLFSRSTSSRCLSLSWVVCGEGGGTVEGRNNNDDWRRRRCN